VIDGVSIKYEDKGREMEKVEAFDEEKLALEVMELPISDVSVEKEIAEVYTEKADFIEVRKQISALGYHIAEADLHYFADNMITLQGEDFEKFMRMYEALAEDDDVDHVYHNVSME
jgi:transcriptional/translational regulatory protein YebC/TACO1